MAGSRPGEHRRAEIVEAAYGLIAAEGLERFRVRRVAERAGINHATLLHHFPGKEALLHAVVDRLLASFRQGAPPEGTRAGPMDLLRHEFEDMRARLHRNPEMFIVMSELQFRARRDASVSRPFERLEEAWRMHTASILKEGVATGAFRADLDVTAAAAVIMVEIKALAFVPKERLDEVIDTMVEQVAAWLRAV